MSFGEFLESIRIADDDDDSYLHLCERVVSFEVSHVIDSQLQIRVVTFKVMRIVVGVVIG